MQCGDTENVERLSFVIGDDIARFLSIDCQTRTRCAVFEAHKNYN